MRSEVIPTDEREEVDGVKPVTELNMNGAVQKVKCIGGVQE